MKFVAPRPFADPEVAARKLVELANAFESVQDGRIYIEKINGPFLFELKGTPAEYKAGLDYAIAKGWLVLHESGTYRKITEAVRRCLRERYPLLAASSKCPSIVLQAPTASSKELNGEPITLTAPVLE
jgi:hypothetical protein